MDRKKKRASGVQRSLSLTHSPSGNFLIRPSPVSRRSNSLAGEDLRSVETDAIEKEFLELDMLTEDKLMRLANTEDLTQVRRLEFRVDTGSQSISQLGRLLPCLGELVLDDSVLSTFRDFGTSLRSLKVLHVSASHVKDLDGISALDALEELYVECNYIKSLTPLAMHENIHTISLRGNLIADLSEIDQLGTCFKLENLDLSNNAVANVQSYRRIIAQLLPQLKSLDKQSLSASDRKPVRDSVLDEASMFLASLDEQTVHEYASPALTEKNNRASQNEEGLIRARPSTPRAKNSIQSESPRNLLQEDLDNTANTVSASSSTANGSSASSELTHGSNVVFAGNLAASMRKRKKATQVESAEARLRKASQALSDEGALCHESENASPLLSARTGEEEVEEINDDDSIEKKLQELLALSSGLEKEFIKLQSKEDFSMESPKAKLLRKNRSKSSTTTSSRGASKKTAATPSASSSIARLNRKTRVNENDKEEDLLEQNHRRRPTKKERPSAVSTNPSSDSKKAQADEQSAQMDDTACESPKPEVDRCSSRESQRSTASTRSERSTTSASRSSAFLDKVKQSSGLKKSWKPSPRVRRQVFVETKNPPIHLPKPSSMDELSELAQFMTGLSDDDDVEEENEIVIEQKLC